MIASSVTEANIFQALGTVLRNMLPASVAVVRGQQNRVAEPDSKDFVVMWDTSRVRLSTNTDGYSDIALIGSIAGNTLTVTQALQGIITAGLTLTATNILADTQISALGTGTGGAGTYTVNKSQSLASTTLQAGGKGVQQPTQVTIQCDVHGPASADNAQIISTLLRDEYAYDQFKSVGFDVTPLYCNDPRQVPFMNAEQQIEERWVVEVVMQANPVVSVAQQFAGTVAVSITDII